MNRNRKNPIRGRVEVEKLKGGKEQLVITEIPYTMIGANIGKFLNDIGNPGGNQEDDRYRGYFQPVLQRRDPYCSGTEKGTQILRTLPTCSTRKPDWRIPSVSICWQLQTEDRRHLGLKQIIAHHVDFAV